MSQKIIDLVTAVVAPAIPDPYELVDIEYEKIGSDYILSVLIDKPGGITVEDTADLTEIISPLLDTIPLKTKEALKNAVGQYINVSLYKAIDKIKIFQGDLLAFDGETLTIDYLDKTRHKTVEIPYQTVAKARLAVKL